MNSPPNKWIEAISVLNELTQTGELTWKPERGSDAPRPPSRGGLMAVAYPNLPPFKFTGISYSAIYGAKKLRISSFSAPQEGKGLLSVGGDSEEYAYALDILSNDEASAYRVPVQSGLNDLFRSIDRKVAGIDDLLNSLLEQGVRLKRAPK